MKYAGLVLILILIISFYAFGEYLDIKITGKGTIQKADTIGARSEAFDNAIKNAVAKGVKDYVSDQALNKNSKLIEREILSKASGYIKNIEVVDEGLNKYKLDTYEVTASVSIDESKFQKNLIDLGLIKRDDIMPKVLIFIQEKNIDDVYWHFQRKIPNQTEITIGKLMGANRFRFTDQSILIQNMTPDEERAFYIDDKKTMIEIANKYSTDMIITGKAISRTANNSEENISIQASVNLKAIQTTDGKQIASSSGNVELIYSDALAGGNMAIAKAAEEAALKLIPHLNLSKHEPKEAFQNITLLVNGLKSIEDLVQFHREFEKGIDGIKSIERRTYSGNTAAYDIVSIKNGSILADEISVKGLQTFKVEVRSKSPNFLELNLKVKR
ncbi:MAG: hypothetical protein J7K40_08965 [candidate division Zixibacteria bacterium]|nr:hypothetical protein [candidate division Zixibacteria bacterium]